MAESPFDLDKVKNAKTESQKEEVSPQGKEILTPDLIRDEKQKGHIHNIKMICFYVIGFFVVYLAFVTVWHMSMPQQMRWLTRDESINLKGLFFTGVGAGILGKFGNKLAP